MKEGQQNEANTRLLLIDEILEHVLGWPREAFNPEEYARASGDADDGQRREWLDYHLRQGEVLRLVVEAKRVGKTFSLPANKKRPRCISLQSLMQNRGRDLKAALRQASKYCTSVGTYGFVVTNGVQWIASLAFVQGVRQEKFQAVIYYDLEDIRSHLGEFIELLSPDGLANQTLISKAVSGDVRVPPFARALNDERDHRTPKSKNYLAAPLGALMGICFGDLTDNDHSDMLEQCYVTSETTDEYLARFESFAGTNLPTGIASASTKLDRRHVDVDAPVFNPDSGGVSFVVGRAGSGKSTFLAIAKKRLQDAGVSAERVLLHIDLLTRTQTHATCFDHDRLISEVCSDLLAQAETIYPKRNPFAYKLLRDIFAGEIRRLESSLSPSARGSDVAGPRIDDLIQDHMKEPLRHMKAYLGFLARCGAPAIILLDNVDRGTTEFEQVTFQLARTLAQKTHAAVVLSMRDTTYESGRVGGFLDVSRNTAFTIGPPPFAQVVRRRFDYAQTRLQSDPALGKRLARALRGTPVERVLDFAEILSEMVLGGSGDLGECVQALAGTNIRRSLEYLEDFATSPHTDLNKLFRVYQQSERRGSRNASAPVDAFLRSVMRGRALRYFESRSKVVNLLQISRKVVSSHFAAVRILQILAWRSATERASQDMLVGELIAHIGALGYGAGHVTELVSHLGRHGLVVSLSHLEPPWDSVASVRLGAAGRYYLNLLLYNREYIENIVDDTVIYDELVANSLESIHHDRGKTWPQRIGDKTRVFLLHLTRQERDELGRMGAAVTRPPWLQPVAESIGVSFFGNQFRKDVGSDSVSARGSARTRRGR